jgi:hypothetical protein
MAKLPLVRAVGKARTNSDCQISQPEQPDSQRRNNANAVPLFLLKIGLTFRSGFGKMRDYLFFIAIPIFNLTLTPHDC